MGNGWVGRTPATTNSSSHRTDVRPNQQVMQKVRPCIISMKFTKTNKICLRAVHDKLNVSTWEQNELFGILGLDGICVDPGLETSTSCTKSRSRKRRCESISCSCGNTKKRTSRELELFEGCGPFCQHLRSSNTRDRAIHCARVTWTNYGRMSIFLSPTPRTRSYFGRIFVRSWLFLIEHLP